MPTISEMYPGKYLSAPDLKNQEVTVTIERVEMEQFDDAGRKVMKPVVYFQGSDKAMVFNKTNATSVVDITGLDNTDNWGGVRICLYPTMVQFGAQMREAIRVKRPLEPTATLAVSPMPPSVPPVAVAPTISSAPAVPANSQADAELNDEIPWK